MHKIQLWFYLYIYIFLKLQIFIVADWGQILDKIFSF